MGWNAKFTRIPETKRKASKKCCTVAGLLQAVPPSPLRGHSQAPLVAGTLVGGDTGRLWCAPPPREGQLPFRAVQGAPPALKPTWIARGALEPGNKPEGGVLHSRGAWQVAMGQLQEFAPCYRRLK